MSPSPDLAEAVVGRFLGRCLGCSSLSGPGSVPILVYRARYLKTDKSVHFTSSVRGRGNRIGPVCVRVLLTTLMAEWKVITNYSVGRQPKN